YWWSPDGLLDSVRVGASTRRLLYQYNAFGQLVRRTVNGVVSRHFVWDGDDLLAELDSTLGARRSEYAHYPGVDAPYALLTGATAVTETRFIQRDGLGNVLGLTTAGGSVAIDGLETEVWGYPGVGRPPITAQDTLRLGWKGLLYEADSTQLYYVRARWYDPKTRRFVSEDPIGLEGGINPYVFAENDPVNLSDPTGLAVCTAAEVMSGRGTLNTEDGPMCVNLGGGQVLPGVRVTGSPWPGGGGRGNRGGGGRAWTSGGSTQRNPTLRLPESRSSRCLKSGVKVAGNLALDLAPGSTLIRVSLRQMRLVRAGRQAFGNAAGVVGRRWAREYVGYRAGAMTLTNSGAISRTGIMVSTSAIGGAYEGDTGSWVALSAAAAFLPFASTGLAIWELYEDCLREE
ncbi:MAG: RHS repeat-associated core domain-containing protein, partial [Gemmatimonadaceae bacterium]|nr:RHS repeat-associated core domain-containing protein [Gemmatimonadaceae bacterium]